MIELNGRKYSGRSKRIPGEMIRVERAGRERTLQIGGSSNEALAVIMLGEIVRELRERSR